MVMIRLAIGKLGLNPVNVLQRLFNFRKRDAERRPPTQYTQIGWTKGPYWDALLNSNLAF